MGIIKKLEANGIDVKGIVQERLAESGGEGGGGLFELLEAFDEKLAPLNITTAELLQIADDCGLSLEEIVEIYTYLTGEDGDAAARLKAPRKPQPGTPDYYLFFLEDWLKENNVNLNENKE
jgi:hypothetical protein